jgi:ABC-type glycerol-3-phosphate transport system substrate-binding protein
MFNNNNKLRHSITLAALLAGTCLSAQAWADAYEDAAKKWVDSEFKPSTLSVEQQMAEMKWFIEAAKPFRGMSINVVSETLTTHEYESKTLAKAFSEITGIKLTHDLLQEGDVVEKLQTQMQSDKNIYDGWVNDSDLIGTHFRYGKTEAITDMIANEGKNFTSPTLDLKDFIGISFTTAPDGKVYQLPDQQFANLYWFRADWFERADLKARFKEKYGYELGVPVNWSAYEDIAKFFSEDVKEIDGKRVYGHMDYGKKDPSLGWRFTDAWFSMAGGGDKGLPNGLPVDEWGIRVEDCHPVGSSVTRGGDTNGPAAVYATQKYVDWMRAYAPPEAQGMTFSESGPVPAQGNIAQQIFWYTAFTAGMTKPGAQGTLLGGGHETGLSGHWRLDLPQVDPGETAPGSLALRTVRDFQERLAEENHRGPDAVPRVGHQFPGHDRAGAQARWPGGVLPQPRTCAMDPDRDQRAGLSTAGSAVVESHRRGRQWREDPAAGTRWPGQGPGRHHGTTGTRQGATGLRAEDEPRARCPVLVRPARRTQTQTGQREAQGRDRQLRSTAQVVGGGEEVGGRG